MNYLINKNLGNNDIKIENCADLIFYALTGISLNSVLMTDDYRGYSPISKIIEHGIVNHSQKQYVNGLIHTNTIEGFWALLKRGIVGQYHKVSIKYLNEYINEFCFKYNNINNVNTFDILLKKGVCV